MTLTFDHLTLKLVCFIVCGVGNVLPIVVFMELFVVELWAKDGPHDFATLTFDFGGHHGCLVSKTK